MNRSDILEFLSAVEAARNDGNLEPVFLPKVSSHPMRMRPSVPRSPFRVPRSKERPPAQRIPPRNLNRRPKRN